jgi:O-antigen ligase
MLINQINPFIINALQLKTSRGWMPSLENLLVILVFTYGILGYLSLRGAINTSVLILLIISLIEFFFTKKRYDSTDFLILAVFSGLFFSTLLSQIIRNDYQISSLDGPSRLLAAGILFIWLRRKAINLVRIFETTLPVSLLTLAALIHFNVFTLPYHAWGGRFATNFVDPNTLGSQTMLLGFVCFGLIRNTKSEPTTLLLLKILGGCAGLYISFFAQSRGGWIAFPFMIFIWFIFSLGKLNNHKNSFAKMLLILAIFSASLFILYKESSVFKHRIEHSITEISRYKTNSGAENAIGLRLQMWEISLIALRESPWVGYGEDSFKKNVASVFEKMPAHLTMAQSTLIYTGPHSDLLAKSLSSGIFGLLSYLGLIFVPMYIFFKQRSSINRDVRFAGKVGILITMGFFITGLSNENLSLKYLCSFYGVIVVMLLSAIYSFRSLGADNVDQY